MIGAALIARGLRALHEWADKSRVLRSLAYRLHHAGEDAAYWCGYKDGRLHRALASTTDPVYLAGYADGGVGRGVRRRLT